MVEEGDGVINARERWREERERRLEMRIRERCERTRLSAVVRWIQYFPKKLCFPRERSNISLGIELDS